jgi:hypothetical protein
MTRTITKLLFVCSCQVALGWLFYRSRAVAHLSWADSDLVVFGVPLLAGFVVSALVLLRSGVLKTNGSKRGAAIVGLAAGCAVISSFVASVVGINLYGT